MLTRLFAGSPAYSMLPEKSPNEPLCLPVTFDPTNSIFEFCGVIRYFGPCAFAGEATFAASPVVALVVSAAGSLQAVKNINPERTVIANPLRIVYFLLLSGQFNCGNPAIVFLKV